MVEFVEWLRLFILEHHSIEYLIIFGGSLVGGEFALFTLGFFVAQKVLPIFPVILISFLGAFTPNIFWFFLGRTRMADRLFSHKYTNKTILILNEAVSRVSMGNHVLALIIIKFLVGTPVLLTMYIHKTGLNFWKFMLYESLAIFLSVFVVVFAGFFSGLGFVYIANIFNNIYASIGFLLILIMLIVISQIWFENKFRDIKD